MNIKKILLSAWPLAAVFCTVVSIAKAEATMGLMEETPNNDDVAPPAVMPAVDKTVCGNMFSYVEDDSLRARIHNDCVLALELDSHNHDGGVHVGGLNHITPTIGCLDFAALDKLIGEGTSIPDADMSICSTKFRFIDDIDVRVSAQKDCEDALIKQNYHDIWAISDLSHQWCKIDAARLTEQREKEIMEMAHAYHEDDKKELRQELANMASANANLTAALAEEAKEKLLWKAKYEIIQSTKSDELAAELNIQVVDMGLAAFGTVHQVREELEFWKAKAENLEKKLAMMDPTATTGSEETAM